MNLDTLTLTNGASAPLPKLEPIWPSNIRTRGNNGEGANGERSAASTLRGLRNRKSPVVMEQESVPDGWTRFTHPDSGVYYIHEEKGVATSSNVFNARIRSLILQGADGLRGSAALQTLAQDQEVDLVFDVQLQGSVAAKTSYYCVSHGERRVFWLEGVGHDEVDVPCPSNKCLNTQGSRAHCIEAQYWKHCELYPTTFTVTNDITSDLKDVLLQAAADRLLVKFSTSPYDKDALEYMLKLVREIEGDVREGQESSGHSAWIIARFMALYNDGVLRSSYGQSDDYFDIEDSGPGIGPYQRPILLFILGPIFFKSPDVFAAELHSFHSNFTLERWSNFVHKVDQSIRDSNLLATVLLNTNMGFLAWANDGRTGEINLPTPAQIVSYISIICSAGSIIIGLAIFKQYRAKGADTPLRAVVVLRRILKEPLGLERLSIICSLPYVLLMWSLITFLAAFAIIFYQNTGIQVRIPITLALFFVVFCLFFCMHTAGPPNKEDQKSQKSPAREDNVVSYSKV